MLFNYVAIDSTSIQREGTVEAATIDSAITAVQKRGYTILSIDPVDEAGGLSSLLNIEFDFLNSVSSTRLTTTYF